ncbi:MAG: hypothetical protein KA436_02665 [Oligoflexales bacterium]|nr:hypothetical protein [Oligoflexales bacterium]
MSFSYLLLSAFLASFTGVGIELILAKTFIMISDQTVIWESLTLGLFMLSFGAGLILYPYLPKKEDVTRLLDLELILGFVTLVSLPLITLLYILFRAYIAEFRLEAQNSPPLHLFSFILSLQSLVTVIGLVCGLKLRLFIKLAENSRKNYAIVLAFYDFGALISSLLFSLVSVRYSLLISTGILGCVLCAQSYGLFFQLRNSCRIVPRYPIVVCTLAFASLFLLKNDSVLEQIFLKNFYYNQLSFKLEKGKVWQVGPIGLLDFYDFFRKTPSITRTWSPYQVIDQVPSWNLLSEGKSKGSSENFSLFINGHFQFSRESERSYHEFLAHVTLMLVEPRRVCADDFVCPPQDVLILGAGDGLLARELLKYGERIVSLRLIELDEDILQMAQRTPLSQMNEGSFLDKKLNWQKDDAWSWLKNSTAQFDAIYADFPYPFDAESARLYSVEFFHLVASHVKPSGFFVFDGPIAKGGGLNIDNCIFINSLYQAGFQSLRAFQASQETFLIALKASHFAESPRFVSPGFALQSVQPDWFQNQKHWQDLSRCESSALNSVFRPYTLRSQDPIFY